MRLRGAGNNGPEICPAARDLAYESRTSFKLIDHPGAYESDRRIFTGSSTPATRGT